MSMDRVLEPSAQAAVWSDVRPRRLALRAASTVFWSVADAGWAACAALANSPQTMRRWAGEFPGRLRDSAAGSIFALFHHRWPIATVTSLLAVTAVLSQLAPTEGAAHAVATSRPALMAEQAIVVHARKPLTPNAPPALQHRLEELAAAYGEPVGVAVTDISDGWVASVMGDAPFPQQSVSKLWVAITALDAIDHGRMALEQSVMLHPEDRSVFNQPISYQFTDSGWETTIHNLLRHALIQSDNAANDKLMSLVGGPNAVRDMLRRKDLDGIKLAEDEKHLQAHIAGLVWGPELSPYGAFDAARSRLPREVRDAAMQAYLADPYDGASPVGIVTALAALKRGELLSKASTDVILETMAQAKTGPRRLRGGLPADWSIAHKTGTGQDFRGASIGINDVGLITAPDGKTYAVAVMMQKTHKAVPDRLEFMQAVTKAVVGTWQTHRPDSPDMRTAAAD